MFRRSQYEEDETSDSWAEEFRYAEHQFHVSGLMGVAAKYLGGTCLVGTTLYVAEAMATNDTPIRVLLGGVGATLAGAGGYLIHLSKDFETDALHEELNAVEAAYQAVRNGELTF